MKSRTARESAALAARLIAVEGYTWRAAFAEARRLFGEPPQENAVAREIRRWFSLFDPQAHEAQLRRKRIAALRVMEALAELDPKLVGVVLGGHAVERSPAEVAVRAESEKEVLFRLFDAGFAPEDFSENYPTALARGPAKVLATFILQVGEEMSITFMMLYSPDYSTTYACTIVASYADGSTEDLVMKADYGMCSITFTVKSGLNRLTLVFTEIPL